jgi:hypothetical protein
VISQIIQDCIHGMMIRPRFHQIHHERYLKNALLPEPLLHGHGQAEEVDEAFDVLVVVAAGGEAGQVVVVEAVGRGHARPKASVLAWIPSE